MEGLASSRDSQGGQRAPGQWLAFLSGTYRAVDFARYTHCDLAEAPCRFDLVKCAPLRRGAPDHEPQSHHSCPL